MASEVCMWGVTSQQRVFDHEAYVVIRCPWCSNMAISCRDALCTALGPSAIPITDSRALRGSYRPGYCVKEEVPCHVSISASQDVLYNVGKQGMSTVSTSRVELGNVETGASPRFRHWKPSL